MNIVIIDESDGFNLKSFTVNKFKKLFKGRKIHRYVEYCSWCGGAE